jgi:hypothetical protein
MEYSTGKLVSIFLFAVLLSCIAAWLVAHRYRKAMQRLMRAPTAERGMSPGVDAPVDAPIIVAAPEAVSYADNRRAGLRLTALLVVLSCVMAVSSAVTWLWLAFPAEPIAPKRAAVVALLHLWPVIPALGLMWRWSIPRMLGVLLVWCVLVFIVMLWRSIEQQPMQLLLLLAIEIGPGMVLVALVWMGSATRAVAPWLLLPFVGLVWASHAGMDLLAVLVNEHPSVLMHIPQWLGAYTVIALFGLVPWLLAWWPLRWLGRALGRAYTRKWLSDLLVMFTTVWAFSLLDRALSAASSAGLKAIVLLGVLLWIPVVMLLYGRWQRRAACPPTLLVLRVFQRDAEVQNLFDHVVERWRLSGNTVMIAGTDLVDRTIDADDIFTFLGGSLAQRFIRAPADVAARLTAFDTAPDADGRYRVNEVYCHDTTWQHALHALVRRSDVVLMDLRGFGAHNAGCLYELGALAQSARPLHVVVLYDQATDRAAAQAAIARRAQRFVWIDASRINAKRRREVLARLFDYHRAAAAVPDAAAQPMG